MEIIKNDLKDNNCGGNINYPHTIHKISCKNCSRIHHKCDKMFPTCSHCLEKGWKCEVNLSEKKRGRPFNTTKENLEKRKLELAKKKKEQRKQRRLMNKRKMEDEHNIIQEISTIPINNKKIKKEDVDLPMNNQINAEDFKFLHVPIDMNFEVNFQIEDFDETFYLKNFFGDDSFLNHGGSKQSMNFFETNHSFHNFF
eukprot:TRINITY_DN546_c0_g1_i1.p1 TRINITY_DN546_c0_g1~~TRINITY_DN546_c0_g1_i1.p1  ORF type:complete len:198 (-),score=61.63 TRINITY_DN546_c0_g1_i1:131-724(-)